MYPSKNARSSSKELQRCLREVINAVRTMPYGRKFMQQFIEIISSLVRALPETYHFRELSIIEKDQISKCQEAYRFFSPDLNERNHLFWVENHELIRRRILGLLSTPKTRYYCMDSTERLQWCAEVSKYLQKLASISVKRCPSFNYEQQVFVNAMHELVEVVRDSDDKDKISNYYEYLIQLCQKCSTFPHPFIIPYPKKLHKGAIESGGSARVYHGLHEQQEVAIKEYRLYERSNIPRVKRRLLKEAYITKIMQYPNIIPFVGIVQQLKPLRICIVVPWMKNGDIVKYLAARSSSEPSREELLEQVADGLHFMQQYGIAHGDLKGGNVLISDDGKALISDFGLAALQENIEVPSPVHHTLPIDIRTCKTALREGGMSQSLASSILSRVSNFSGGGTLPWMAPERLLPENFGFKNAKPTFASDVFSYAMLAIEVYTGERPHAPAPQEMAAVYTMTNRRPRRPPNVPDPVWKIIERCWSVNAYDRPSIFDVYSNLAGMDSSVLQCQVVSPPQ
ncbi:hypothetical protein DXG01_003221 [Tephrocybe rancida]|nr:hypothetical protein DXG01_003221 [Tephrocybe rancida]